MSSQGLGDVANSFLVQAKKKRFRHQGLKRRLLMTLIMRDIALWLLDPGR